MSKKKIQSLALLAFLIALPLKAADVIAIKRGTPERRGRGWEQRAEFEAPVKGGARLLLRAEAGAVDIRPEPGDEVKCVVTLRAYTSDEAAARRLFDRVQLSARPLDTSGVYLLSQTPGRERRGSNFSIRFQLSVPPRFNLDVETQGGDITVEAPLDGEARLTTAGGDVRAADLAGPVRIETAGGSITLGKIGSRLEARTAGGSIRVDDVTGDATLETSGGEIVSGQVAGTLRAETAGGDVVIGGATGPVTAQTAGGQIQIGPAGGSVRAETAGGSIRLQGARGRVVVDTAGGSIDLLQVESTVKASTAAGRILAQFSSTTKTFGSSQLETSMGDVFVYLPINLPLTVDAAIDAAAGHKIVSDFPLSIQGEGEEVVPTTLRGRGALNGGGEVLRIRTVAGNIEIRKLDEQARRDLDQREASAWKAWGEQRAAKDRRRHQHEEEQKQRQRDEDQGHDDH
jgi:DUF4097 and DUF4098 domain-containing protein YvlB